MTARTLDELEAAVARLFEVALINAVCPVPGRNAAVVIANPGETFQAFLWDYAVDTFEALTAGHEPVGQALPDPTGERMAVLRDTGGDELYRLWVQPIAPGDGECLTDEPLGRVHAVDWLPDGGRVLLAGNDDADTFVSVFDLSTRSQTKLFTTDRWFEGVALAPDGSKVALSVSRGDDRENFDIVVFEVAAPGAITWISTAPGSRDSQPLFSPDSRLLAFNSEVADEPHVAVVDLATGAELWRQPIAGETETLVGWDGAAVVVLVQRHGRQVLLRVDAAGGATEVPHGPGSVLYAREADGRIALATSSFVQPPEVAVIAPDGRMLGSFCPTGALTIEGDASDVWIESRDGTKVHCWVVRPERCDDPGPAVVMPHGGPTWASIDAFRWDVQEFVLAGFTVIAPNFRGSTGYGPAFRKANVGDLGGGDFEDTMAAASWIAARPGIDPARIAIYGGSYGGYMTLWAMVREPEAWACGAAVVPVADWVDDYELADATFRYFDVYFFGGTPDELPELYAQRSPITYVDRLARPLLISHGRNDSRCPFPPVERFVERGLELGKSIEFDVQEDEGHGAAKKRNRVETDLKILRFLRRFLYPTAPGT